MTLYLGVDFGTTYSLAGTIAGDDFVCLTPGENGDGIPSIPAGQQRANVKRGLIEETDFTLEKKETYVRDIKSIISTIVDVAKDEALRTGLINDGNEIYTVFTYPHVLGKKEKEENITVFKEAIQAAGFEEGSYGLMEEPVAAIYAIDSKLESIGKNEKNIIFDLGGGTLDLALMKGRNVIEATSGLTLGGTDFTINIQENTNISWSEAERVKRFLSDKESTTSGTLTIRRSEFEYWSQDTMNNVVDALVNDATLFDQGSRNIYLIGGATRMPQVK
ncbi:MAG: Hsp70 family protein, partial [Clostridia bacterium]|nr:Hsp70 family protein [Clostridia bacterium]